MWSSRQAFEMTNICKILFAKVLCETASVCGEKTRGLAATPDSRQRKLSGLISVHATPDGQRRTRSWSLSSVATRRRSVQGSAVFEHAL